jgi:protein-disulfide isomerase
MVQLIFRDFPLENLHPHAMAASTAAHCVGEQGATQFWDMHNRIFRSQRVWANAADPDDHFLQLVREVGADVDQYNACLAQGEKQKIIARSLAEGETLGFTGTPSFHFVQRATGESFNLVGAQPYGAFAQSLEIMAEGGMPTDPAAAQQQPQPQQPAVPQAAPAWATAEGLAPDPDRPGFTMAGDHYRGDPDAAVVVVEFADFQCPFCRRHAQTTQPALDEEFVETGQVMWVFKHFPLDNIHPQATPAGIAAECAAEQGNFWEMYELLFERMTEWSVPDSTSVFNALAEELDLDMERFTTCFQDDAVRQRVQDDYQDAVATGFTGTPSFKFVQQTTGETFNLIGAQPYATFAQWLATMAEGGRPTDPAAAQQQPQPQQPATPQAVPAWATAEALAPDPDRPGFTMAGDHYRGNPEAEIVVVEFADFQCPFCRRHAQTTQPALDEEFVETGEVMWVFKHFPLDNIHPQATPAGIASECAAEQGNFWEMYELLFERMEEWSVPDSTPVFTALAEELDLDIERFSSCFQNDEIRQRVQDDLAAGSPYISGTPSFIVLSGGGGYILRGALPIEQFQATLRQTLSEIASR